MQERTKRDTCAVIMLATLLAGCSGAEASSEAVTQPTQTMTAAILAPEEGEGLGFPDGRSALLKVTPESSGSRRIMMGTELIPSGTAIPVHSHDAYEEVIFIHRGYPLLTLGDETVRAEPGTTMIVPPGTWHGVESDRPETTTMLFIFPEPAIAGFFRRVGQAEGGEPPVLTGADWAEIMARHSMRSRD